MSSAAMTAPQVFVHTTSGRGFTPEEIASRCADKLVGIADTAHPAIREQARAYKATMAAVVAQHIREGIASDRTTVYNALKDAGHAELADLIRRL
jgi:hypothetical protein